MLHSLQRHLHLLVLLFLSIIHVCFLCIYVGHGRAIGNAQWLLLLQKQQRLGLERTGFGIFCRNEISKRQKKCAHNTPPPINYESSVASGPSRILGFIG